MATDWPFRFIENRERKTTCDALHVVVTLGEGYIIDLFGPYHGASNDLNLLHESGFMDLRRDDEWTLGDGI